MKTTSESLSTSSSVFLNPSEKTSANRTHAGTSGKRFSKVLAKLIRAATVPPISALIFVLVLALARPETFALSSGPYMMVLFLTVFPLLAYPLSALLPMVRRKGREGQRNLAFVLSGAGYALGFLYGLLGTCTKEELIIYTTYLLSVILLLVFNKLLHIRASGHTCSVTGPVVLCSWFFLSAGMFAGAAVYAVIMWASLKLKRHTVRDMCFGSLICIAAAASAFLFVRLIR